MVEDNSVNEVGTRIPVAFKNTGVVQRNNGRWVYRNVSKFDVEAMRLLLKFKYANLAQIAGMLGSSYGHAAKSMSLLSSLGYVESMKATPELRHWDAPGERAVRRTQTVYRLLKKGSNLLPEWVPAGAGSATPVRPSVANNKPHSLLMVDHSSGVLDLAVQFRRWGCEVVSEREMFLLEPPNRAVPGGNPVWCPGNAGGSGRHVPDLGVLVPNFDSSLGVDFFRFGVELERAVKPVSEYARIVRSYREFGLNQMWFVSSAAATRNLVTACRSLGIGLESGVDSAGRSFQFDSSGSVRLFGWSPGFSFPDRGELMVDKLEGYWGLYDSGVAPGALSGLVRTDFSGLWRVKL